MKTKVMHSISKWWQDRTVCGTANPSHSPIRATDLDIMVTCKKCRKRMSSVSTLEEWPELSHLLVNKSVIIEREQSSNELEAERAWNDFIDA